MSDWLSFIFTWIAPPVIGAAIGYITNDIAIRMLFRPLTEKRIFGIRVPFTPGIIPKERYKLAESIGRMVSQELLTEDAVRTQIASPRVQAALKENISSITGSLLSIPLSKLKESRLEFFQASVPELLHNLLTQLLSSPVLLKAVEGLIDEFLRTISEKKLGDVVTELRLNEFLNEKITALIEEEALREKLAGSFKEWVHAKKSKNETLTVLISDEVVDAVKGIFRSVLPHLHEALLKWLGTEEMRHNLQVKGKLLLDDILSKLNIFQRFFVSVGQYDRSLSDKMPEIVDDFVNRVSDAVKNEADREAIVESLGRALEGWRTKSFSELFQDEKVNTDERIDRFLANLFDFLRREKLSSKIAGALQGYLASRQEESLGALAESLFGLTPSQVTAFIMDRFTQGGFVENVSTKITDFVIDFFVQKGDLTVGEFFGVDAEKKDSFDTRAAGALDRVLEQKIPEALKSLDIQSLVENKINSLDIMSVEGLLLMVIAKQLKWINVFGAILGALIGLVQLVLRLF